MPKQPTWTGPEPTNCEICDRKLDDAFIDGKTVRGVWAVMCPECHSLFGFGLGAGFGQRYAKTPLPRPLSVEDFWETV